MCIQTRPDNPRRPAAPECHNCGRCHAIADLLVRKPPDLRPDDALLRVADYHRQPVPEVVVLGYPGPVSHGPRIAGQA